LQLKPIAYWTTTTLLALALLSGGIADAIHVPQALEGVVHLGYPVYFATILGVWKMLGAIALLVPRFPRLKEWAYAGVFFEMTSAAISHAANHDASWHVAVTLGFAAIAIVSWALRPPSRIVGAVFPTTARA
jgi:uncharacterized membrane protein YphA (DoxX/SURF4 family)